MSKVTPHQDEKINEAIEILKVSNRLVFQGSAGTGKTYAVEELLIRLCQSSKYYKRVVCAAPTHQAVAVLASKVSLSVDFQTVHSLLKYRKFTDKDTGKISFKPFNSQKQTLLEDVSLLVIDEASMIGTEMLGYLEQYGKDCTIIFVGDEYQINPVGEKSSPVFLGKPTLHEYGKPLDAKLTYSQVDGVNYSYESYPVVELFEIIRQGATNPVIKLSQNISDIWNYDSETNEDITEGFVYTTNEAKIIYELSQSNGSNQFKYLAWTNLEVDRINTLVRREIYGLNPAKIELGETIVFSANYHPHVNNEQIKVEKLDIETKTFNVVSQNSRGIKHLTVKLKCYIINGKLIDDWGDKKYRLEGILVIHEDSEYAFKQLTYTLSTNCKNKTLDYVEKDKFIDTFANFHYNHAITVHKSQGSTYDSVALNITNIDKNRELEEKERLFYTGITRTKNLLILYHP